MTDVVREAITRGDLEPGRRLTERELGELTGVSRMSLREALRSLQAEGLVERSESRGIRVAVLASAELDEKLEALRVFYQLLLDAAGNSILQQLFGSIEARIHALRRVSLRIEGRATASRQELSEIVTLIERRDGPAAAAAARARAGGQSGRAHRT